MKTTNMPIRGLNSLKMSPSPTVYRKYFETQAINPKLHPYYLTGFADAESCFYVRISPKNKSSIG